MAEEEEKHLTPVWIVYVDGKRLDTEHEATLRELHKKSGLPLKKFFNTSGMLYREQNLSQKLPDMSEDEQFKILASDGMLVKRPLLVTESSVCTGFKEAEWKKILGV